MQMRSSSAPFSSSSPFSPGYMVVMLAFWTTSECPTSPSYLSGRMP